MLACALAVLGWWMRRPLPPAVPDHLTVAVSTTPHAALFFLAQDLGYFEAEGLDVRFVPASHGKAAMDLLMQGKADLATMAEVPFAIAVAHDERIGMAMTVASTAQEMAVVARRDRGIQAPKDLEGKRVGMTSGTSGDYFLWALMVRHQMAPDSVIRVDLPPGKLVQALNDGDVDAIATWEPVVSSARGTLKDAGITFTAPNAYTVTHVVVGRTEFLSAHARALSRMTRALIRAEQFDRDAPDRAFAMVARRLGVDTTALRPSWTALTLRVDLRQSQLITLEDETTWARARGLTGRDAVPDFLPHVYLDAMLATRPDRVTIVH